MMGLQQILGLSNYDLAMFHWMSINILLAIACMIAFRVNLILFSIFIAITIILYTFNSALLLIQVWQDDSDE